MPDVHYFDSTAEGYTATQTREEIADGDVLLVPSEGIRGVLVRAWPVAITSEHGSFHTLAEETNWEAFEDGRYLDSVKLAESADMSEDAARLYGWTREAFDIGREAGRNAASWTVDGNTSEDHIRRVLRMLEDGDPEAFDYLPARPDLSGQWADNPTPRSLFEEVTGCDAHAEATWNVDAYAAVCDAIAEAFEAGVDSTFEEECETVLRASLPETPAY